MSDDTHVHVLTHAADTISAGAIVGVFAGLLPPLAAFVAICWYAVQIFESDTVQSWLYRRRVMRRWRRRHYRRVLLRHKHRGNGPDFSSGEPQ